MKSNRTIKPVLWSSRVFENDVQTSRFQEHLKAMQNNLIWRLTVMAVLPSSLVVYLWVNLFLLFPFLTSSFQLWFRFYLNIFCHLIFLSLLSLRVTVPSSWVLLCREVDSIRIYFLLWIWKLQVLAREPLHEFTQHIIHICRPNSRFIIEICQLS